MAEVSCSWHLLWSSADFHSDNMYNGNNYVYKSTTNEEVISVLNLSVSFVKVIHQKDLAYEQGCLRGSASLFFKVSGDVHSEMVSCIPLL